MYLDVIEIIDEFVVVDDEVDEHESLLVQTFLVQQIDESHDVIEIDITDEIDELLNFEIERFFIELEHLDDDEVDDIEHDVDENDEIDELILLEQYEL